MSFAEETAASRRLAMLRVLREMDGRANESVLATSLRHLGFQGRALGDGVRSDLAWLAERDLLTTSLYGDTIMVGEITRRGLALLAREIPPVDGLAYPKIGS